MEGGGSDGMHAENEWHRFHAWQSSLLFSAVFIVHLIFSFSSVVSWIIFVLDLAAMGFLAYMAYRDGESLRKKLTVWELTR